MLFLSHCPYPVLAAINNTATTRNCFIFGCICLVDISDAFGDPEVTCNQPQSIPYLPANYQHMRRPLTLLAGLLFIITSFAGAQSLTDTSLLACIQSFNVSAISSAGRESAAASMPKHYFPPGSIKEDRLGNLVITIGSGNPRRLLSTSLDEPAYVISSIQPDGYCRVT